MRTRIIPRLVVPLVILSFVLSSRPSHAEGHAGLDNALESGTIGRSADVDSSTRNRLLSARRLTGFAFIGGSLLLLRKGNDYNDEADELYERYEQADNLEETERLYDRTTNRDVKSQVSWALAAAFAVNGVRLVLTNHDSRPYPDASRVDLAPRAGQVQKFEPGLWVESWYDNGRLGLRLARSLGAI